MFELHEPRVFFKSSENMGEIDDNAIQLVLTSPPYGKIKDYGTNKQIGFKDSFETYFSRLKKVWRECHRILEPQSRVIINVGDQYLRTKEYGRYRILPIGSRIIQDCLDIGFDFLGDIIWQKISTTNTTGGCSLMGSIYYPRNGLLTYDYEHILIFKKVKGKKVKVERKRKELSKIPLSEWKRWFVGHWKFPGIVQKEHIAMFPEELPHRIVRMFSHIGDTVLDPFAGSGTTLKIAKSLFRKSIGYEINPEFESIINDKTREAKAGLFKDYQFLLYKLYTMGKVQDVEILFSAQKRKGVIAVQNSAGEKLLVDYLFLKDNTINNPKHLHEALGIKMGENSVKNYLNGKKNWEQFNNYAIVVNSEFEPTTEFIEYLNHFVQKISSKNQAKPVSFILYDNFVGKGFALSSLFRNSQHKLNQIPNLSESKKKPDLTDFL